MKGQFVEELKNKLNALGVPAVQDNQCDLKIETTFIDAKWGSGEKKIGYTGLIGLSEEDHTIYMYEKTIETGSGISFGEKSGTTFQSGKTLYRKVKSVQYDLAGKAYEYELDLGLIPKTVKMYSEQIGWKFKTVLSLKKVMMAGAEENQPPIMPQTVIPQQTHQTYIEKPNKKKSGSRLASILWIIFLLLILLFMWLSETSIVGIALAIILILAGLFATKKKGCLFTLIIWFLTFVIVFFVYMMTTDLETNDDEISINSPTENSTNTTLGSGLEVNENVYNFGCDVSYAIAANDLTDYQAGKTIHELKILASVIQDVNVISAENEKRIIEVRIKDFEWIQAPKLGTFANLSPSPGLNIDLNPVVENNILIYDTDAYSLPYSSWQNSFSFNFEIIDIGTYQYPADYTGTISYDISAKNLGLVAEDVSCSFKYTIELTTVDGTKYVSQSQTEVILGDFLYGGVSPLYEGRIMDISQATPFNILQ